MRKLTKLRRAKKTGKICGVTDKNGNKYNGQIQAVEDDLFLIHDRNLKKDFILSQADVRSVRCG